MVRTVPNDTEYNDYSAEARKVVDINVQVIKSGVANWEVFRKQLIRPAKLGQADLSGLELIGINLANADLRGAKLINTNLANADLSGADLRGANLVGAYLYGAKLAEANLLEARLQNTVLQKSDLRETNLLDADLTRSNMRAASLRGAFLFRTRIDNADLDECTGIRLDSTFVRGARLPVARPDRWSLLRRRYTGFAMLSNLLFVLLFLLPLAIKAAFWLGINEMQNAASPTAARFDLPLCLAAQCQAVPIWQVLLGFGQGPLYAGAAMALLVYNALRLLITVRVAPLREEEERSGFSPRYAPSHSKPYVVVDPLPEPWLPKLTTYLSRMAQSYGWMYWLHVVLRLLAAFAFLSLLWRVWQWLHLSVFLPLGR